MPHKIFFKARIVFSTSSLLTNCVRIISTGREAELIPELTTPSPNQASNYRTEC